MVPGLWHGGGKWVTIRGRAVAGALTVLGLLGSPIGFAEPSGAALASVPKAAQAGGLLAYYSFDDSVFGRDDSGNGNTLTPEGIPAWTQTGGAVGGFMTFDGVDDALYNSGLSGSAAGDATLACWFRASPTMSHGGRILDFATASGIGLQITIGATGRVGFDNSGGPSTELKGAEGYNDGTWHHVAAVRTGTTYTLFIDGTQVPGSATGTAPVYSRLFVARRSDRLANNWFEGSVDEVRVYARALSGTEILDLYNQGSAPPPPPPPPPPPSPSGDGREGANGDDTINDTVCGGSVGAWNPGFPTLAAALAAVLILLPRRRQMTRGKTDRDVS